MRENEKRNMALKELIIKLTYGNQTGKGKHIIPNPHIDFTRFMDNLLESGMRPRAVRTYLLYIHKFFAPVKPETLRDFRRHIIRNEKNDSDTIRRRNYFVYLVLIKYLHCICLAEK